MTTRYIRGVITVTSVAVGFASISFMSWMGWQSIKTIENSEKNAVQDERIESMTASLGDIRSDIKKLSTDSEANRAYTEWIVNRFGVKPESVWKDDPQFK